MELLTAILVPVADLIAQLVEALAPVLELVAAIISEALVPIITVLAGWLGDLIGWVVELAGPALGWLTGVLADVIGWVAGVIGSFARWASGLGEGIAAVGRFAGAIGQRIGDVIGFFVNLPNRILTALGNLGALLFNAGKNIIQGLIDGVNNMVGRVTSAVSSVVQRIRDFLPFSPAKVGPLSGSGSPELAGRRIGAMLADGMLAQTGQIAAAADVLAGAAAVDAAAGFTATMNTNRGGSGGAANVTARAPLEVRVFIGDTELRGLVRTEVSGWASEEIDLAEMGDD